MKRTMTETVATYQVDSLPVNQLPDRYGIGRSAFYERVTALNLQFGKKGNKSIANADQIDRLDALHDHLKRGKGNTIDSFINSLPAHTPQNSQLATIEQSDSTAALLTFTSAILNSQKDPLAHIRSLQEACDRGWLLSSSELAPLLKLNKVIGQTIERYGFTCTRIGRNGIESAWKITQK